MNIITQYDNGTFEDVRSNWGDNAGTYITNNLVRSDAEAFTGTYSGLLPAPLPQNPLTTQFNILSFTIPLLQSTTYFFSILVKVDQLNGLEDSGGLIFPSVSYGAEDALEIVAKKVSEAANGWVEVNCSFKTLSNAISVGIILTYVGDLDKYLSLTQNQRNSDALSSYSADAVIVPGNLFYNDVAFCEAREFIPVVDTDSCDHIYHVKNQFLLNDGSNLITISEPIKWDDIDINISFDEDTFGYKFEFTDGDVLLEFDSAAGGDILRALYLLDGVDAFASLKFGEIMSNDEFLVHYEAELNFSSYIADKNVVKMSVERRSFQDLFRSRYDTKVDLFRNTTLDGNSSVPPITTDLYLHPNFLKKDAELLYNQVVDPLVSLAAGQRTIPVPMKITKGGIDGLMDVTPIDSPSFDQGIGQFYYSGFDLPEGVISITLKVSCKMDALITIPNNGAAYFPGFQISQFKDVSDTLTTVATAEFLNGAPIMVAGTYGIDGFISQDFVIERDSMMTIRIGLIQLQSGSGANVTSIEFTNLDGIFIEVEEIASSEPAVVKSLKIHEAIDKQIELILSQPNKLKSDFLGRIDLGYPVDGCASENVINSGKMVRGFDPILNMSAKSWYDDLSAIYCMGLSIERDIEGVEFVRFEELPYFFRDIQVFRFDNVANYSKSVNKKVTFNELKLGYKNYPNDNEAGSLGEHLTEFEYLTPIRKFKKKFTKISNWILSSGYIELTKRKGLEEDPSAEYKTDDNIFMVDAMDAVTNVVLSVDFVEATSSINVLSDFVFDITVAPGDVVTVTGTGSNNRDFIVGSIVVDFESLEWKIIVQEGIVDELGANATLDMNAVVDRVQSKRDRDYIGSDGQFISGVSPEAARDVSRMYNLGQQVKRVMLRWAKYFNSGLKNKEHTSRIRFVIGKNRTDFGTRLKDGVECNFESGTGTYTDNYDDYLVAFAGAKSLFSGNIIKFKWVMCWNDYNDLRKAYEGRSPDAVDYGYISLPNPEGIFEQGYPRKLNYNPVTQELTGELYEKGDWTT